MRGLLYEGNILAYDPSTNQVEVSQQVSVTDLSNMVPHSPTRGEDSLPVPPSRLRKFTKDHEEGGATSAMKEEDQGRGNKVMTWFPPGLEIRENLEKWEGIFQSGKSQGILSRLEKSGNFAQNTGKTGKF